jgi:iron complex transport system substrate-binding protein
MNRLPGSRAPAGRARRPSVPRHRWQPALRGLALLLTLAVAACSTGSATIPPDATGSAAPPATATPTVAPSPAPDAFPVRLLDDEGNAVLLEAEPRRIVSLTPANTEILFALGAGDRVVATTDFDDYPPEAVDLPDVASYAAVDVEKIVGLEADLVVAGGNSFNDPEALARMRSLGIPVLVVYAATVDAVLDDIRLIGQAVGRAAEADALAAAMETDIASVAVATADLPRPRTFYEIDAPGEIYGPADDSFLEQMIELAGGEPITTGSATAYNIPLERLVVADPEVIVLGDANYGVTAELVAARPGWDGMTAVRAGAIRPVNDTVVTRPGPRLTEGLRALVGAIHPDLVLPPPVSAAAPPVAAAPLPGAGL